jgi:hypothetical protein
MTDGELERRYEALRRAAAAVLEVTAADAAPVSPAYQKKLDALEQTLHGHGPRNALSREILDPDRHYLSMRDYQGGVPGGIPFSLADRAQSIRRSMAKDDVADHRIGDWPNDWDPTLTELQAMIVATLLQELAVRLTATGDPGGEELAAVALELADEVLAPTFAGAQR